MLIIPQIYITVTAEVDAEAVEVVGLDAIYIVSCWSVVWLTFNPKRLRNGLNLWQKENLILGCITKRISGTIKVHPISSVIEAQKTCLGLIYIDVQLSIASAIFFGALIAMNVKDTNITLKISLDSFITFDLLSIAIEDEATDDVKVTNIGKSLDKRRSDSRK